VTEYNIRLDDQFGSLTLIDVAPEIAAHPHQGYTVPRRVEHRTRAPVCTAIPMVEAAGVQPTGD
jgi:hypothetical protein